MFISIRLIRSLSFTKSNFLEGYTIQKNKSIIQSNYFKSFESIFFPLKIIIDDKSILHENIKSEISINKIKLINYSIKLIKTQYGPYDSLFIIRNKCYLNINNTLKFLSFINKKISSIFGFLINHF